MVVNSWLCREKLKNGKSDQSMKDLHNMARIGYVIENYDKIVEGDLNYEYKNKDNSYSKNVILQKKIDDNYFYVVEAVPDTARKTLHIVSAYINKNDTFPVVSDAESLDSDVQNELQSNVSFDNSIPQNSEKATPTYSISEDSQGRELSAETNNFFRYAQTRDENGALKPYYHGTSRADRVGYRFDPNRATSGPMAYFTDSEEIAGNYARDKQDTSLAYDSEYNSYETQFRVNRNILLATRILYRQMP